MPIDVADKGDGRAFEPRNPDYRAVVEAIFAAAPFVRALGLHCEAVTPGMCCATLPIRPDHLQRDGFVHAAVQAALADHTAGAAAATLMAADEIVLTIEFKINLMRPAKGKRLWCEARVLRPGSRATVAEAEVFADDGARRSLVAKAMVTLTFVMADAKDREGATPL